MSIWKLPPLIKVYEALGSIADGRINVEGNSAKVTSSSLGKFYTVKYDPDTRSIMCNDNGSYWQDYLGYPAIAYLLLSGTIPYSSTQSELLKDIKWKDINSKYKNDWDKTQNYCENLVVERGGDIKAFKDEVGRIHKYLEENIFSQLGIKVKPPKGY